MVSWNVMLGNKKKCQGVAGQRLRRDQSGLTLIGVLLAFIMLAIGIMAAVRLFTTAEHFTSLGREKFVASNLAREGLELVRAKRDSNWFAAGEGVSWTAGLCDPGGDESFVGQRDFAIDAATVRNHNDVLPASQAALLLNTASGQWHHPPTSAGDQPTPYRRVVTVDCTMKNDAEPRIEVTSTVEWQSQGDSRTVDVKENLYDWLPTT